MERVNLVEEKKWRKTIALCLKSTAIFEYINSTDCCTMICIFPIEPF